MNRNDILLEWSTQQLSFQLKMLGEKISRWNFGTHPAPAIFLLPVDPKKFQEDGWRAKIWLVMDIFVNFLAQQIS